MQELIFILFDRFGNIIFFSMILVLIINLILIEIEFRRYVNQDKRKEKKSDERSAAKSD